MPAKGVVDALTNTYTDIAKMMLLPDAQQHMQFLQGLQQGVMKYIQMQANASMQNPPGGAMAGMGGPGGGMGAPPGMGGPPPMGGNPGGPGAPPAMSIAPGGGAGMSGLMGGAPPDDLRRLLAQGAQQ
jgi:hypothetical protein